MRAFSDFLLTRKEFPVRRKQFPSNGEKFRLATPREFAGKPFDNTRDFWAASLPMPGEFPILSRRTGNCPAGGRLVSSSQCRR
jgi:hypothetical protein